ncbi:hypothetical protein A3F64_02035 [Candidatus Saccharibacteria bacterium RIFCSPHIGHO2_12_FULL_42_8]|nr:MAG: hypothetical protein A3F64_02035 [Candidatus Saccharibacteria bacterium RIFCSPHIGHO2_12_FULL_42_8]
MHFIDDGEVDDKIIVVPADDRNTGDTIKSIEDVHEQWKQKVEHHFNHYKDLKKPGSTKVQSWGGIEDAQKVILESIERWKNQA